MRSLIICLLLGLSSTTQAAIPLPPPPLNNLLDHPAQFQAKQGFFQRMVAKKLLKQLGKNTGKRWESSAKTLAITGFAVGLLTIASWLVSPYLGIIFTAPLVIGGLVCSLAGLLKARRQRPRTRWIIGLSIAGLVLNGLLGLAFASLFIF